LIAGLVRDPQFGAVRDAGRRGVLAEASATSGSVVPVSEVGTKRRSSTTCAYGALLGGFSGEPLSTRTSSSGAHRIMRLAADRGVVAVDVNPLVVVDGRPVRSAARRDRSERGT
jgi:hypothetical protein